MQAECKIVVVTQLCGVVKAKNGPNREIQMLFNYKTKCKGFPDCLVYELC